MKIKKFDFGKTSDGQKVEVYELINSKGTTAKIITYGARLTNWIFNDIDIVLGYDNIAAYEKDQAYMGAIVGRCANRIGGAKFELNGKIYNLDKNDGGKNHLHGGFNAFEKKIWSAKIVESGLKLTVESPDGECGYPGNFKATVIYNLTDDNELEINYSATTDADTLCNLTNHAYFNLDGFASGDVLNQKIQIFADSYTWANEESVPDGRILPVTNTPLDLRKLQTIGEHIDDDFDQLNFAKGYDQNFCIGKLGELKKAAFAEGAKSGIKLEIFTTMPGLQFYAGNFLNGNPTGKGGTEILRRSGFALESQFYPNAINCPNFDQPILKAGECFQSKTIYKLQCFVRI